MSTALPQHCPSPRELDDLELLMGGALAPRTRFDAPGDAAAVVTLDLPAELQGKAVELVDPEGLPLARQGADGSLTPLALPAYGPFRRLYLTPAQARQQYAGRSWIPVTDALTDAELQRVRQRGRVVLLALVGHGTPRLGAVGLLRATEAAAAELPDAVVVAVPLASHDAGEAADSKLREQVVARYAGGDPVWPLPPRTAPPADTDFSLAIAAVVATHAPQPGEQGLVLFFTGLSGSGKSTLARALMDRVLEQGERSVTSLDGDVVRRNLSAGLTFSKADRETNIRRIGWVAAEVARHGGVAVVSPIAPFDETRQQVRQMVEDAGGRFFLVHVATPLAECERRDRKGLYAKARRGEIPEFTGISSPYEEPADADVVVDTTGRSIEDALGDVVRALADTGHLDVRRTGGRPVAAAPVVPQPSTTAVTPPTRAAQPTSSRAQVSEGRVGVVYVCTANVCRSPFMELSTPSIVGDALEVASTGTEARPKMKMDDEIAAFLPDGASPRGFRSHTLSADYIEAADVVLTAEQMHVDVLLEQHPAAFRKIFTLGQFAETVAGSDLRGRELIAWAGHHRVPASPAHDIADPYGNGRAAAEVASTQILGLLKVALPPLAGA